MISFLEPLNSDFNDILILVVGLQEPNIGGGFFAFLANIALAPIDMSIGTYNREAQEGLLNTLFKIATLIPGLALGVRRLRDTNKSAWSL